MKRLLFILVGALFGVLISYGMIRLIGIIIMPFYTPAGEDDMSRNFTIFLVVVLFFALAGSLSANFFFKKYLTNKSSGRKKPRR